MIITFMISMAVIACVCIVCDTIRSVAKMKYKDKPVYSTISQDDLDKIHEETKLPNYDEVLKEVQHLYMGGDD